MLMLRSPLDHRGSWHLLMLNGRREASFSTRDCRLARGEAELNNAGCGNYIVQAILVRIRDHEAFRAAFGPRDLQHRISNIRNINRLFHNPPRSIMPISISQAETQPPCPSGAAGSTSLACKIASEYRTRSLAPWRTSSVFSCDTRRRSNSDAKGVVASRSLVESHGGRLWAADNHPRGASSCFTLPTRLLDFTGGFHGKEFVAPAPRRLSGGHPARPSGRPEAGATISDSAVPAASSGHASVGGHFRHSVGKHTSSIQKPCFFLQNRAICRIRRFRVAGRLLAFRLQSRQWKVIATYRWRGEADGQQLHVSLRSDVVPVRTARGSQGVAAGCELRKSGHQCTGLGDVEKRSASLEGSGKSGANQLSRRSAGRRSTDLKGCHSFFERSRSC